MSVQLINQTIRTALSREQAQIELVVYFGRKFDRYLRGHHWRMLLVLADWALQHDLEHCAKQARRAAEQIRARRPVTLKLAVVRNPQRRVR
jgi:hypothetical protein